MRLPTDTPARRSDRDLAEALRQARANLDRRIASIRAERPEFMPTGLDLPGLLGLIPEGGALVAPLFTSKGSAVFVLPHGTATVTKEHVVELDRFTEGRLARPSEGACRYFRVGRLARSLLQLPFLARLPGSRSRGLRPSKPRDEELWEGLLGPVHERLKGLGLKKARPSF